MTALTAVFRTNRAQRPASALPVAVPVRVPVPVPVPVPSAIPVPVRAPEQTVRLP